MERLSGAACTCQSKLERLAFLVSIVVDGMSISLTLSISTSRSIRLRLSLSLASYPCPLINTACNHKAFMHHNYAFVGHVISQIEFGSGETNVSLSKSQFSSCIVLRIVSAWSSFSCPIQQVAACSLSFCRFYQSIAPAVKAGFP